jgi:hypothetical protein
VAQSILDSVKKVVGLTANDVSFDLDIIMHTNSVLATLTQLGVGPDDGFEIEDNAASWDDFLGPDKRYNFVKSYVYLRVRVLFDPPTASSLANSFKEQIDEYTYRINVLRESDEWMPAVTS